MLLETFTTSSFGTKARAVSCRACSANSTSPVYRDCKPILCILRHMTHVEKKTSLNGFGKDCLFQVSVSIVTGANLPFIFFSAVNAFYWTLI